MFFSDPSFNKFHDLFSLSTMLQSHRTEIRFIRVVFRIVLKSAFIVILAMLEIHSLALRLMGRWSDTSRVGRVTLDVVRWKRDAKH